MITEFNQNNSIIGRSRVTISRVAPELLSTVFPALLVSFPSSGKTKKLHAIHEIVCLRTWKKIEYITIVFFQKSSIFEFWSQMIILISNSYSLHSLESNSTDSMFISKFFK